MVDTSQVMIISGAIGGIILIAGIAGGIYVFSKGQTRIPDRGDTTFRNSSYNGEQEYRPDGGRRRKRTRRNKRK